MAGLSDLQRRIEKLGSAEVKTRISARVAKSLEDQCYICFARQRDPYGIPWALRKDPGGAWPILIKSGMGLDSVRSSSTRDAARVFILGRMKFHQTGTMQMVARRFFPDSRGLGLWQESVNAAALEAIRELMKGQ